MLTHLFCILEFKEIKLVKDLAQKKCVCRKGICLQTEGKAISAKPKRENSSRKTDRDEMATLFLFCLISFLKWNFTWLPGQPRALQASWNQWLVWPTLQRCWETGCCQGCSMVGLPGGTTCVRGTDVCLPLGSPRSVPTSGDSKDRAKVQICSQIWWMGNARFKKRDKKSELGYAEVR